jgi:hypothetical protein
LSIVGGRGPANQLGEAANELHMSTKGRWKADRYCFLSFEELSLCSFEILEETLLNKTLYFMKKFPAVKTL